jgi:hypothetical protein
MGAAGVSGPCLSRAWTRLAARLRGTPPRHTEGEGHPPPAKARDPVSCRCGASPHGPELRGPELHGPELHGPELHGPELHGPKLHGPELHGPEYLT